MSNQDEVINALRFFTSSNPQERKKASDILENGIASADQNVGFTRCLIDICSGENYPIEIRQAASIQFKYLVEKTWDPESSDHIMIDDAKNAVKDVLFDLCLQAPKLLFKNLETALSIVCDIDFPHNWPNLLSLAKGRLSSLFDSPNTIPRDNMRNAERCMASFHAIVAKYRKPSDLTTSMAPEFAKLHTAIIKPLLACLSAGFKGIDASVGQRDLESARASCAFVCKSLDCLHDTLWLDLSDEYEKDMDNFISAYSSFLRLKCEPIERSNSNDSLAEVKLRTLNILSLHIQKYAEETRKYVSSLANDAWNVLQPNTPEDAVVIAVVQFIEHIARAPALCPVLEPMVEPIINTCIMPNVELDDYDVDIFEEDPQDYIEHDVEGTDQWTRRRAATELIRALIDSFYNRVGPIFTNALQNMIQNSKNNWKSKDGAMFLVTALAARGIASSQRGTVGQLTNLVNVPDFYNSEVMPLLQLENGSSFSGSLPTPSALLKASAIRFVSTFRQHIPLQQFPSLFELLAGWVSNDNVVLFSYSAHAIDRLLSDTRIQAEMIDQQLAGRLLQSLCTRLAKTPTPNEHLTRAISSVVKTSNGDAIAPYVGDVTMCLHTYLKEYAKNAANAQFTHFLFESISWLIRRCPQFARQIESALWETMMLILQQNLIEMMPYVLQIVAQLLDTIQPGTQTPQQYIQLLQPCLSAEFLGEKGNIPAVIRVIGAFLRQGGQAISQQQHIVSRMFEVSCNLMSSKTTDTEGFLMMVSCVLHLTPDACREFIMNVWHTIMKRLQGSRTVKFEKALVIGVAAIAAKYGGDGMAAMLSQIQENLFPMFCNRFIFLSLHQASSRFGKKCALLLLNEVALTLVNSGRLQNDGPKLYTDCVMTGVKIIASGASAGTTIANRQFGGDNNSGSSPTTSSPAQGMSRVSSSNNNLDSMNSGNFGGNNNNNNNTTHELTTASDVRTATLTETGFTNSFCPLKGAQRDPDDPFPQVENPMRVFVDTIKKQMNENNQLQQAVQNALPQPAWQMLMNS